MVFLWFSYSYVSHNQMVHGIQRMAIAIGSPSTQEDSHCAECNDGYYLFSRDCQERWDQVTSSVSQDGRYKNRYKNTKTDNLSESFSWARFFFGPGFSLNCQRCPRMVWKLVDVGRFAGQNLEWVPSSTWISRCEWGYMNQTSKNLCFFLQAI